MSPGPSGVAGPQAVIRSPGEVSNSVKLRELAAMQRTGVESISPLDPVSIVIRPGFLLENQRLGRSPPDIVINPLVGGPQELCRVKALASYLSMSPDSRGS